VFLSERSSGIESLLSREKGLLLMVVVEVSFFGIPLLEVVVSFFEVGSFVSVEALATKVELGVFTVLEAGISFFGVGLFVSVEVFEILVGVELVVFTALEVVVSFFEVGSFGSVEVLAIPVKVVEIGVFTEVIEDLFFEVSVDDTEVNPAMSSSIFMLEALDTELVWVALPSQ